MVESGAGVPKLYAASIPAGKTGPQLVRDLMAKAVRNKFNTVRFFAFGVRYGSLPHLRVRNPRPPLHLRTPAPYLPRCLSAATG